MKKYTLVYQLEIEAKDIEEAERLAEKFDAEFKRKARLVEIKGMKESLEMVYESKKSL